jgi:glutathione synthase
MRFLFLMDPLETVKSATDTSFAFMIGAQRQGHEILYCPTRNLSLLDGEVIIKATRVTPKPELAICPFDIHEELMLKGEEIDAVFIRTDPPFDGNYLMNMWMLDHLPDSVVVINKPQAIRDVNEKVWAARFTHLTPRTLITSDIKSYLNFLNEEGQVILKPTDGFGGAGIFHITAGSSNAQVAFETLSDRGAREVIAQAYVKEAQLGDKRILLLNGEILGAVLRVSAENDHRNNFYAGGTAQACEITDRDREVCAELKPHLQAMGLYFTGIDMLGDKLIEVNVTSPTCLQEMNRLYDCQLEDKVIAFTEDLIKNKKK